MKETKSSEMSVPEFEVMERDSDNELLDNANFMETKLRFRNFDVEQQREVVSVFTDEVLISELNRRLVGRKESLNRIGEELENVHLTDL